METQIIFIYCRKNDPEKEWLLSVTRICRVSDAEVDTGSNRERVLLEANVFYLGSYYQNLIPLVFVR